MSNLFEIPENGQPQRRGADPGTTRVPAQFIAPAPRVLPRAQTSQQQPAVPAQQPSGRGLSGGLESRYEFSTGRGLRPRSVDETLIPEGHGARAKLGVMVAMFALIVLAVAGGVIAFAANR